MDKMRQKMLGLQIFERKQEEKQAREFEEIEKNSCEVSTYTGSIDSLVSEDFVFYQQLK